MSAGIAEALVTFAFILTPNSLAPTQTIVSVAGFSSCIFEHLQGTLAKLCRDSSDPTYLCQLSSTASCRVDFAGRTNWILEGSNGFVVHTFKYILYIIIIVINTIINTILIISIYIYI